MCEVLDFLTFVIAAALFVMVFVVAMVSVDRGKRDE